MGRLKPEFLNRIDTFADRVSDVAEALERAHRPRRVVDQMYGCGTSVGANTYEADEAVSRADFCRALGISKREASEVRFWLASVCRRGWVTQDAITPLQHETSELIRIFGSMIANTRDRDDPPNDNPPPT